MSLNYNIDQLVVRDGQLYAYGWGFYQGAMIKRIRLRLEFENGAIDEVDAEYGSQRDDVSDAFAATGEAQNAGFLVMAGLGGRRLKSAILHWDLADGRDIETTMQLPVLSDQAAPLGYYKMLLLKALALGRAAGVRALWRKMCSYLSNQPRPADDDNWTQLRQRTAGRPLCVIVDHDLGGGANIYRDELIAQRCSSGERVLLLSFHMATLQYFIQFFGDQGSRRYSVEHPNALLPLAAAGDLRRIIYNNAVSFRGPLQVPDLLTALKQQNDAPLLFLLHDYFAICPSHCLINADEVFCGVPEPGVCNTCLASHRDGFVSLTGIRDIGVWRSHWGAALQQADEIRVFSEASRTMLRRAYPALAENRIRLVPHKLHTPVAPLPLPAGSGLHIGVVGLIGRRKGAGIVAALAEEIIRRRSPVKISVIGTLDVRTPREVVQVSGPYEAQRLPVEIKNSGANVFLFPSIWGETFSYTSHELVAMELPFACFDFGAQADLARRYNRGLVLESMDAAEVLDRLQAFWRLNYRSSESAR